ncbi:putative chemoreceptor [Maritalea myrionectae]|uniref:Putative chemoreceptor n=1 Tax=Maritalea myrionectae TaxID=454601 RepID=A0A2R4MAH4_9HYPH|nr:methyl-accepting chemotaxis protein [Maritalea myrionectae]AVX03021.1 putative chemoreceptor [Maritalea myrionectae]
MVRSIVQKVRSKLQFKLPSVRSTKISTRIVFSTALSALTIALIGVMFFVSEQQKASTILEERNFSQAQNTAQIFGLDVLQVRRFQKDYIANDSDENAQMTRDQIAAAQTRLADLRTSLGQEEIAGSFNVVEDSLTKYASLFDLLVETSAEISINQEESFLNSFRATAKDVSKDVGSLKSDSTELAFSEMRNYEREFLLFGGARNIMGVDKQIKRVTRAAGKAGAEPTFQFEIADKLEVYNVAFDEYAGAKERHNALSAEMDALYDTIAGELEKIIMFAMEKGQEARTSLATMTEQTKIFMFSTIAIAFAAITILGFVIGRSITKPLNRITGVMGQIANGEYGAEVPFTQRKNELGEMARAVEVFRNNGLRVNEMTEEEKEAAKQRTIERAAMMSELQSAFGQVVDAAIDGDFTQRVEAKFPDEELNRLAEGVNSLVETVDRGLQETGSVLSAMANTDLSHRVEGDYRGSFLQLKNDTNAVGEKLSQVIGQLRSTSRGLKVATGEILSGANDLSERTTKQAAAIEETSAATEQLANTVNDNTERAQQARTSALEARQVAEKGGEVMHSANDAMSRITASSNKISDIIGMIDDIAFQTNLLALNASVEAARAGEAGKGFAVVAVEVRRLAQSAAEASSEVKTLIEQSVTEVDGGSKLVAQASENLEGIVNSVRGMTGLMDEIASQSQEQSSAINEISQSIREMDEMTQHNAALVEETNAAIDQTEAQASQLDKIVDQFVIERGDASAFDEAQADRAMLTAQPSPEKRTQAAKAYMHEGNVAVDHDSDWQEF